MDQQRELNGRRRPMMWKEFYSLIWGKQVYTDADPAEDQSKAHVGLGFKLLKYSDVIIESSSYDLSFPAYFGAFYNPVKFWLITQDENNVPAFDLLSKEINAFYNADGKSWELEESDLAIGLPVAFSSTMDGTFHRGVIFSDIDEPDIKVFMPDDGSFHKVPRNHLRYLRVSFLKLPAQALPAKLAEVNDTLPSGMWKDRPITKHFRELVANKKRYYIMIDHFTYLRKGEYFTVEVLTTPDVTTMVGINTILYKKNGIGPEIPDVIDNEEYKDEYEHPVDNVLMADRRTAPRADIDRFTTSFKFSEKELFSNCVICQCDFISGEDARQLRCTHIFHEKCADHWLLTDNRCPVCRRTIGDWVYYTNFNPFGNLGMYPRRNL